MLTKTKASLMNINYRLFTVLLITGFVPTIYLTLRVFFLGNLPGDWGFNVASQLAWVNILLEVVQEAIFLPLFFFIASATINKGELANKTKTGLLFTAMVFLIFSLLLIVFAKPLLRIMSQSPELIEQSTVYIRLESVAILFAMLYRFLLTILISMKKDRQMYLLLAVEVLLTVTFDTLFLSNQSFSLNLGVNGIAITNIIVKTVLTFVSFVLINTELSLLSKIPLDFSWLKGLFKVGGVSGVESLIRNLFFMFVVLRMVNAIGESGCFWVANNFIWGWLQLPVLQLGELIKRDVGESSDNIQKNLLGYIVVTAIIVAIWFVTVPLWKPFMKNVLSLSNYQEVFNVYLISVGFYVLFAFNNIADSMFYGRGKTSYMLFQSIVINTLFYVPMCVLYLMGIYKPTLMSIALMFAIGVALDSLLTFCIFICMMKKVKVSDLT